MAEVISIIGSIIAIVELTAKVGKKIYQHGDTVIHEEQGIADLEAQLAAVEEVAKKLEKMVRDAEALDDSLERWPTLAVLRLDSSPLTLCKKELDSLDEELTLPESRMDKLKAATLWPHKKKKIEGILERVVKQKDRIVEALEMENMSEGMRSMKLMEALMRVQDRQEDHKVLSWLSNVDPMVDHEAAKKNRQEGTGEWFIRGDKYIEWRDKPNSFLWLHGFAGCGKTVLSSTIIEEVLKYCRGFSSHRVAYFYFSFGERKKKMPLIMIQSILAQLVKQMPRIPQEVYTFYDNYKDSKALPAASLKKVLCLVLELQKETFIIIDALDECPIDQDSRNELCSILAEINNWKLPNIHTMVTSRADQDIKEALTSIDMLPSISVRNKAVDADIQRYIRAELENLNELQLFAVIKILKAIPLEYQTRAHNCLRWLSFAERPLTLTELAEAAILDSGKRPNLNITNRLFKEDGVIQILGSLVNIRSHEFAGKKTRQVMLAHFSIKEFLTSSRTLEIPHLSILESQSHRILTRDCLIYLLSSIVRDSSKFILQDYALSHWTDHYRKNEEDETALALAVELLTDFLRQSTWLRSYFGEPLRSKSIPALHIAAWKGLRVVIDRLLKSGHDINAKNDGWTYSALQIACMEKHPPEFLEVFINNGAEINETGGEDGCPLQATACHCQEDTVKLFLNRGADVNAISGWHGTALIAAVRRHNLPIIKTLMAHGADMNANAGVAMSTIMPDKGDTHVVNGANALDSAVANWELRPPSTRTATANEDPVVKLLIDAGAHHSEPIRVDISGISEEMRNSGKIISCPWDANPQS
ncbi:ankyrin repeat protein [Phlyctema vagabunda]|uniref:Ankyrin repeat protein n=1 Tax=Phlyctema vagabunda TaxID=108571 RepID=A0ABR4PNP2_9HELO